MKIAIVHLSDIHIQNSKDVCFGRRDKLANTVLYSRDPDEEIFLVVSGDIANTGTESEYAAALDFFRPIFIALGLTSEHDRRRIIFIPGNHDCDFQNLGDLRPRLLSEIDSKLEGLDSGGETANALLSVQSNFFNFCKELTGEDVPLDERLYRSKVIAVGNKMIEFRCFNSAWLSKKHEDPGSLGFPKATFIRANEQTDSDIVVAMVHHPSNWMSPSAHHQFRKAVQENADFLFTGHEHTSGGQLIAPFGGPSLVHFESGPLQPRTTGSSDFGILHIDLGDLAWTHEHFSWSRGGYARVKVDGPHTLAGKAERVASLQIQPDFLQCLNDPGTGFLHPRQTHLRLSDIYVYPDLKVRKLSKRLTRSDELPQELKSHSVAEKLLSAKRTVVTGPSDSGKTALSKTLYLEAYSKYGRYPILLCGGGIRGKDPNAAFCSALESAVTSQYGDHESGRFAGLSAEERVLLVDNWEEIPFNRAGRTEILKKAKESFGCILVFSDDVFLIDEMSPRHEELPLAEFETADLREFGFRLRGELIRKWHLLGNDFIEDEQTLARHIADSTNVVDTVLGRNLLPSYPVNILTLLQTYDAGVGGQNSSLGSYGQVYEALVTARLAKVSDKAIDIGTTITFLARFAWRLFEDHQKAANSKEWDEIGRKYFEDYRIRIDTERMRDACTAAGLLTNDQRGIRFAHGYGYCYFVAKYFQENLADLEDRAQLFDKLKALSERVYNQDNANIVILYVFLTKDRSLINHVVASSKKVFEAVSEFNFESHLDFVNRVIQRPQAPALPETRTDENQKALNQQRDEAGERLEPDGDPSIDDLVYSQELPFEQQLVIGIRYITLMGQFLRNFPGSLKADTKTALAVESYSLGLRILGIIFELSERDSKKLTDEIAEILRRKMAFKGLERELLDRAELIVAEMLRQITYGLLKRLSHAVGLKELEETYDDVAKLRGNTLPNRIIRLAIELDHFEKFPNREIQDLMAELQHNNFTMQTLQDLVFNHLYVFPRDYATQQWVGSKFEAKVNTPPIRGHGNKLLGAPTGG